MVQKVFGMCEAKNGTETDELLQAWTDGHQKAWNRHCGIHNRRTRIVGRVGGRTGHMYLRVAILIKATVSRMFETLSGRCVVADRFSLCKKRAGLPLATVSPPCVLGWVAVGHSLAQVVCFNRRHHHCWHQTLPERGSTSPAMFCVAKRHKLAHVPRGFGAHDEVTGVVGSIGGEDQGGCSSRR